MREETEEKEDVIYIRHRALNNIGAQGSGEKGIIVLVAGLSLVSLLSLQLAKQSIGKKIVINPFSHLVLPNDAI